MPSKKRLIFLVEARELLVLTGPIVLAQLSQTAMGVVDTVMAGWAGKIDLAAVAVGSSLFFPLFLFQVGLLSAVVPLVSQAHGQGQPTKMRAAIRQGCGIGLCSGILLMVVINQLTPLLQWMQVAPDVLPLTQEYLYAISWGFPFSGLFLALRNGGDGASLPRLSMITGFLGLTVNILANSLLIFGRWGFPKMGGVGCGWATTFSLFTMWITMYLLLHKHPLTSPPEQKTSWIENWNKELLHQLKLGLPLGFSLFIECSLFALIALMVSRFGAAVVAAHQIALNFTSLLFMIPYSLSCALSVRVGFTIGRQNFSSLSLVIGAGLCLALLGALLTATFISLGNHWISSLYTDNEAIRHLAGILLLYAAVFQIPDALQVNFAGALRGCKDTKIPMYLIIFSYWCVGLPSGCFLGLNGFLTTLPGPQGFWIGLISGLSSAAILLGIRLYSVVNKLQRA